MRKGGIGDARQKIIAANRDKTVDARDKLSQLARGQDARQKLQKLRNLKDGNLEVKKLTSGITVTKKLDGKISLSTKSRSESAGEAGEAGGRQEVQQIGRLTKTVSSSGQVSLSSKSAASREEPRMRSASAGSRAAPASSVLRGTTGAEKENVRRSAGSGRADRFDEELLAFRKTVDMGRSRLGSSLARQMDRDRSPVRGRGFDYDNPRSPRREREPEPQARRDMIRGEDIVSISPLQGTMVTITNLQSSVTQEDIEELFGDIGSLKKAQVCVISI